MRSIAIGFVCLIAAGCADDESVNGVYPSSGFLGRTMRVQVSGDNTGWNDGVTLDFGPGVTVKSVTAASPTSVFAEIEISDTAQPGLRDVVVNDGTLLALHGAFELTSPIVVDMRGTVAQGSVVEFTVHNSDFLAPFDDTCTAASLFGCMQYGNVAIESPPGTIAQLSSVTPYVLSGTLYLDLDAAPGPFSVLSGPAETAVVSPMGKNLEVAARTATAFTGMTTATIAQPFESHLYELDAGANTLARFTTSSEIAGPTLYVLPESGRFLEMLGGGAKPSIVTEAAQKLYLVAVDGSGESDFAYTLRNNALVMTPVAESDDAGSNNAFSNAQQIAMSSAILVTGGSITSDTDEDWYRFTVPANSGSKKVHVITAGGDPLTDTAVEIYANTDANMIGEADKDYHESVVSSSVGSATTIYVRIYTDPNYYDPEHTAYVAAIWLE